MITEDIKIDGISLFDYLKKLKQDRSYNKLQFFNLLSEDIDSIYHCREKLIVIKGLDYLITDNLLGYIQYDRYNQYLVFGKNTTGLPVGLNSFLKIQRLNNTITFEKLFAGAFDVPAIS